MNNFLESLIFYAEILLVICRHSRLLSANGREDCCGERDIDRLHEKLSCVQQARCNAALAKAAHDAEADIVDELVDLIVFEHVE